jgi:Phage tail assembly chaperone protein
MQIRIKETGQLMYDNEFRSLYPDTSFGSQLSEEVINALGADIVFEGPQATGGTRYQYSTRQGVEQIDGKWYTKYVLGPVFTDGETTAAEQEAAYIAQKDSEHATSIRQERDAKLTSSDWTQVADAPVNKETWATYRQALRDVPSQTGFPWEITWPDKP